MELHYIYHSCFAAEEREWLIVYDYWCDPQGRLKQLLENATGKEVYFVVSHFHEDHYNPAVAEWCAANRQWHLLPSYDTVRRRRIDKALPLATLRYGEEVTTPHFRLKAYRSTDVGVCTVARLNDGTTLLHAGDCNNWYFPATAEEEDMNRVKVSQEQMEKLFLSILRDIKHDFPAVDHAMFPVDPRLGQEMLRGPLQLLSTIKVGKLHPMHYSWGIEA